MTDDTKELERLKAAIRTHRDQRADDRCWYDDLELYKALGDDVVPDNRVGDKFEMAKNCMRFLENRCAGGHWDTYAQLEAERNELIDLIRQIHSKGICGYISMTEDQKALYRRVTS